MKKDEKLYFKIDTPAFLIEITDNAIGANKTMGVLRIPMNIFRNYIGLIAQRCTEINDPILNRIMVDMNLYELPPMLSKERREIVKKVYKAEKDYFKKVAKTPNTKV